MKKTIIFIITLILVFTNDSKAQDVSTAGVKFDWRSYQNSYFSNDSSLEQNLRLSNPDIFKLNEAGKYVINFDNIKGSPYEINAFSFGHVTDEISNKSVNLYLRYNIYNDEIELKPDFNSKKILGLLKEHDISCKIRDKYYYYAAFIDEKNNIKKGYLIQVYKGENYSLFKRLKSTFTPKKASKNSYVQAKKAKFKKSISYYIKKGDIISFLPNKKKTMLNKFKSEKINFKNYISKKRPNLKDEKDIIDLVKFLDASI